MFEKEIRNLLFCGMPNAFNIADDSLITGFFEQGEDHDETLDKVV